MRQLQITWPKASKLSGGKQKGGAVLTSQHIPHDVLFDLF